MKTVKICRNILMAIVAVLSLYSCKEPEGLWDSMVWNVELPVPAQFIDGVYNVPAEGTEYSFSCQNYSRPWIQSAEADGKTYYPPREEYNYHTITADWFKVEIVGNKLKVAIEANETASERPMELLVTAGDVFYIFKFKQFANK